MYDEVNKIKRIFGDFDDLVRIDHGAILNYASSIKEVDFKHWLESSAFDIDKLSLTDKLVFVFVLDSISFCYWGEPKWKIFIDGCEYDGAQAMMLALGRALKNDRRIFEADFLTKITKKELGIILRGNTEIPLLEERVLILRLE